MASHHSLTCGGVPLIDPNWRIDSQDRSTASPEPSAVPGSAPRVPASRRSVSPTVITSPGSAPVAVSTSGVASAGTGRSAGNAPDSRNGWRAARCRVGVSSTATCAVAPPASTRASSGPDTSGPPGG